MIAALLALALASASSLPQGDAPLLIEAHRIVLAPGTVLEDDALLIRNGMIAFVGSEIPDDARTGARVVRHDGTVVAGFVNPHTYLQLGNDLAERISPLTPDLRAAEAFDAFDPALLQHARAGVTAVCVAPLSANTFAGMSAVAKTGTTGTLISDPAYMKIALVRESLDPSRYPTSRMGAADLVRRSFAAALQTRDPDDPTGAVLRGVQAGSIRLAIHARSNAEIAAALDLCRELGAAPLLIGADEADRHLQRLSALGASVVLPPLTADSSLRILRLPAALEAADIPFSFSIEAAPKRTRRAARATPPGLPPGFRMPQMPDTAPWPPPTAGHPDALRVSAALAVRHGTSRVAALAALTRVPAEQCGVANRVGSLRQDHDADLLLFDGDPLDLTSSLRAVYIAGVEVPLDAPEASR